MTQESRKYDAIIIGSGQAGNPLAAAFAAAGKTVAVIESTHVGGTCVNDGCTPTKTMVASARVAYLARRGTEYGVACGAGEPYINMATVRDRKRAIVDRSRHNNEQALETTPGIELIRGLARFTGPKTVEVALSGGDQTALTAELIFINTGLRSGRPEVPGLETVPYLDNVSIMEIDAVPEHLLVLGGGYIGLEFGQMFRRFGSRVSVVQSAPRLLMREDEDVAEDVRKILVDDGIEVLLEASATRVRRTADSLDLDVKLGPGERTLSGSHLLIAAGRVPNTDSLDLKAAGIVADERGFIWVNERLETSVAGTYALGDVKGGPAFTHISYDDFRVVRANLLEGKSATTRGRMTPYTVFVDPELGRIGLTEDEARKQGLKIKVAKMPMTSVARAQEMAETRGSMKVIVEQGTDRIVGAAILGIWGGEVATMVQIAMMGGLPFTALRDGIFSHPTLAESFNNLLQKFE